MLLLFPDTVVDVACKSLCATIFAAVLDEVVGVVPFDAGSAEALVTDAVVAEDNVLITAVDDVLAAMEVGLATDDAAAAAALNEGTPPGTFG